MQFDVVEPTEVDAAIQLLRERQTAIVYAGGVQALSDIRLGNLEPTRLVSLKNVRGLQTLDISSGEVRLGAALTIQNVADDAALHEAVPLLTEACRDIGNQRVRRRATLGGNIWSRAPKSDLLAPLLVHDATIHVHSESTSHDLPIAEFLMTPPSHDLLLMDYVSLKDHGVNWHYARSRRRYKVRPLMSAAVGIVMDGPNLHDCRVAIAGLAPTATRLEALETSLRDQSVADIENHESLLDRIRSPLDEVRVEDDLDATAWYKKRLGAVMIHDCIKQAIGDGRP